MKTTIRNLLGESTLGFIDFHRYPTQRNIWGGAFNGQSFRRRMFVELEQEFHFAKIYETGTFRGATTEFFLKSSRASVFTVECVPKNYGFCRARFLFQSRVHLSLGDSRSFLKEQLQAVPYQPGVSFFYLDAHWYDDLPLLDECKIIFASGAPSVIMIDDFQVPGDRGYTYDDYGEGKSLTLDYLSPIREDLGTVFFPRAHSSEEDGKKRGSLVIGTHLDIQTRLQNLSTLTPQVA